MSTTKQNYLLPIIMMIALFGMISFVTGLANPMGVIVKNQFGASNFMATLGYFANFIAYAFMGYPAGMLLQKIGYKQTALIAIAVGFLGTGIQFLSGEMGSFGVYLLGAFVAGFSMCMLNTVVNPMLNKLGGGGNKGNQLIQVGGSFNSLMATIVPILVGYFIGSNVEKANLTDAYPALFLAMGIFAAAFLVFFFVKIPEPSLSAAKSSEKAPHSPFSFRHFVLGAVAIFLYVGIEVGVQNFINPYMTEKLKYDATIAGSVVGTYWFLMLVGRLVGAAVGGSVSSKAMLSFVSVLGIAFTLAAIFTPVEQTVSMPVFLSDISFGIVQIPTSIMFLVLCGLCTSVMWGGIFNLAVEGLGRYTEAASGFFMVMVCGGGIIPLIQGAVADSSGYIESYWVIVVCLAFLLYYALIGSKNVNTDIPVDIAPESLPVKEL
ncbi:MFS transporter [Ornithobacterium rhinotracheale]|uniref:MFS transporter n=1 Tax=Ornithobacterium rhinotracheale TaxID=28251 RepID=A0A410JQD1_ORNRH|nr:MFS transporter [Ornithobacterium rhinotracheale]QAR30387.1 MFS transporter [Ornithobacterium rhinotracheale]